MQKAEPPVKKNEEITLCIDGMTTEGAGVGRTNGYAVFVSGALPGETVGAHIIKVTSGYAVGKLTDISVPSPERTAPRCPAYAACGGCTLQHMAYPAQLLSKRQAVYDALSRLGGLDAPNVLPTLGMDDPWRYRNKGSFPFARCGSATMYGFYAPHSHRLVPLFDCPIQDERVMDLVRRVNGWANENRIPPYDETTGGGALRHVMARVSRTGERLLTVVTRGPLSHKDALLDALEGVESVWHNRNDADTNVIFGETFTLLAGSARIRETIGDLRFSVSPQSFLQVNPVQTERLYEAAVSLLDPKPEQTVLDAYCGIGTISLLLAGRVKRVIGVEIVAPAVEDAKQNARVNGIQNAEFLCDGVENALPRLLAHEPIDAVVLDPPRKGCEPAVLDAIGKSGLARVVYVSCSPSTLARDCRVLADYGFSLLAAQPVDMFPHTAHVETVVLMSRVKE